MGGCCLLRLEREQLQRDEEVAEVLNLADAIGVCHKGEPSLPWLDGGVGFVG